MEERRRQNQPRRQSRCQSATNSHVGMARGTLVSHFLGRMRIGIEQNQTKQTTA